jgi:KaiC/GvpD/RAD55 family RecA-like ATPase
MQDYTGIRNANGAEGSEIDGSDTVTFRNFTSETAQPRNTKSILKAPTLRQLLEANFSDRQHLLFPWLREQESCMVYAETGVGKSMFALSAALAVAGGGEFLGWKPDERADGSGWRVLYIDGEMHIADIKERAQILMHAVPSVDQEKAGMNLRFLARQQQEPDATFPLITEPAGMEFVREVVRQKAFDLVVLDNFSTLGEVEDENAASSFNAIQQFLLQLKVQGVATMLVHHAGKSGDFRGSSKLAATFETILKLERLGSDVEHGAAAFRVCWHKVRAGGPKRKVREVAARLIQVEQFDKPAASVWDYATAEIDRLYELKERLEAGEFLNQKEIAHHFGVTPTMAGKYVAKGLSVALWTKEQIGRWFAKGKSLRARGKTEAPIRPSSDWMDEPLGEGGGSEGTASKFETAFD